MDEFFSLKIPLRKDGILPNGGCMFLSTYELEHGRHVARLHHHRRRHRRAYTPTSNTASHDTHEKINSWVSFCSLIWVWGSAWRPKAAGAPLLRIPERGCRNLTLFEGPYSAEILKGSIGQGKSFIRPLHCRMTCH